MRAGDEPEFTYIIEKNKKAARILFMRQRRASFPRRLMISSKFEYAKLCFELLSPNIYDNKPIPQPGRSGITT